MFNWNSEFVWAVVASFEFSLVRILVA